MFTAKIRGEIWRDDKGFYVASFADPHDPMRALGGQAVIDPRTVGGGHTTYGALTFGLDIKPHVPKPLSGLTIRPEFRVDHSFSDTQPFNDSKDDTMVTAAMDAHLHLSSVRFFGRDATGRRAIPGSNRVWNFVRLSRTIRR